MTLNSLRLAALATALVATFAQAAPTVSAAPVVPTYGQGVSLRMSGTDWPPYLPATRYTVDGNRVVVDYEYFPDNFDATMRAFGDRPVNLGELPAGNYAVEARIYDISRPGAAPQVVSASFPVMPPESWGLYTVPANPAPFEAGWAMVRSAAYFDPASMRVTMQPGNVVRVDFTYAPDAPVGSANPPSGWSSFGAARLSGLAPGRWTLEGWGRSRTTGAVEKFFTKEVVVGGPVNVVEFYAPSLDHYFVSAGPEEIASLDADPRHAWRRTGEKFRVWLQASEAPAGARPVCRFYSSGANSHFFTASEGECRFLRDLEAQRRAEAQAKGTTFTEWAYEGIAFYALVPTDGACPAGSDPVYRAYNGRAEQRDSNHRFTVDATLRSAMAWSWTDEGVAFCSPR